MNKNYVISGAPEYWVPAHLSFGRFLFDKLKASGKKNALIDAETGATCTYEELLQYAVNLATGLRNLGVKRGDIVGVCSENRIEYTVTVIGVIFCGATIATASPAYTSYEMNHVLNVSKPKYIFSSSNALKAHFEIFKKISKKIIVYGTDLRDKRVKTFAELTAMHTEIENFEVADVDGTKDVTVILCSSGTTGLPKGVMLTHLTYLISAIDFSEVYKSPDIQNVLSFSPWHHMYGFTTTLNFLNTGKTLVYLSRFQEELFFKTIQNYKINLVLAVPTVVVIIAKSLILDKYDLTSVKEILSGAAPIDSETILTVKKRIPTLKGFIQEYGMTESGCVIRNQNLDDSKAGSAGKLVCGVKAKIVDLETGRPLKPNERGEFCVKSSLLMKGYIGDISATQICFDEDGFFKTGDVGYYTEDELFYIVDRVKELIKYKGNQVPPAEVEGVLMQFDGVKECAVVGKPDKLAGELPTAFVVKADGSKITEQELKDLVASKLSNPKKLRGGIYFVSELPRNPSGKVLRRLLKEKFVSKPVSKL